MTDWSPKLTPLCLHIQQIYGRSDLALPLISRRLLASLHRRRTRLHPEQFAVFEEHHHHYGLLVTARKVDELVCDENVVILIDDTIGFVRRNRLERGRAVT